MLVVLSFLAFLLSVESASQLTQTYDHSKVLEDWYTLHWRVDGDDILLGLEVETTGWVGFGFAEQSSGSMPGGDILHAWVDGEGHAHIVDRHALAKSLPPVDECQDWALISGVEANGITTIEVRRKLNTGDPQDRVVFKPTTQQLSQGVPFPTRIIYAYGTSDTFGYHGANRRATAVEFFDSVEPETEEETYSVDYRVNSWEILPIKTQYVCQTFFLPLGHEHIISFEVILNPETARFVHHYAVLNNPENDTWVNTLINNPTLCFSDVGYPTATWTVWGWGPGTPKLTFPAGTGMSTGIGTGVFAVTLQIHYDNPAEESGFVDTSGVRITYTKTPRPVEVGTLSLGDVYVSAPDIPPGELNYGYDFECPSNCSNLWPNDLNVFASWMHMHALGTQAVTTLHKPGATVEDYSVLHKVEFWDFNFQQTIVFPEPIVVERGDRMNVHCYYRTTSRTEPVPMFIGSEDEMCVQMFYYYPRIPDMDACGYYRFEELGQNEPLTVCGTRSDVKPWPNPQHPDPENVNVKEYGVEPTEDCDSEGTYYCTAQYECEPYTTDYSYASCVNNRCVCKDTFEGEATTYSQCHCPTGKFISWVNGEVYCVDQGVCPTGGAWECSSVTEDYSYVICNTQTMCECKATFDGSATTSDKCRCDGTISWSNGQPTCNH